MGSGKPRTWSKLEKELLWTPAGCQDYDSGRLEEVFMNEGRCLWKKGIRLAHFSGKITVGQSKPEEIWLKRTKKQLWKVGLWISAILSVSEFWSNPQKSLALGGGWAGRTYWAHSLLCERGILQWLCNCPIFRGFVKAYHEQFCWDRLAV